jgi:hypothetical protein
MKRAFGRAAYALVLALGLAGCGGVLPLTWFVTEVEMHRSDQQRLIVANAYGHPVSLESVDGGAVRLIPQNGRTELPFAVVSVAEVEDSPETPWLMLSATGRFEYLREPAAARFLKPAGADIELRVRMPSGDLRPVPLSLQGCRPAWSERRAASRDHPLAIGESSPLPGIPIRICPAP